jgi:hypothetical protein
MKIKYVRIDDQSIVFEENEELFILDVEGNKKKTSEYFIYSPHWNGPSPFFPVNIEADSFADVCRKDSGILHLFKLHNIQVISDMIDISIELKKDNVENCKLACFEQIEELFSIIKQIKEQQ